MTERTTTTFWQVLQRALASSKEGGADVTLVGKVTTDGLGAAGALTTLSRLKLKDARHF